MLILPAAAQGQERTIEPHAIPGMVGKTLHEGVDQIARQIWPSLLAKSKKKVVVLDLPTPEGKRTELGRIVADTLRQRLFVSRRVEVISASQLAQVMREMKLGPNYPIDPASAKKIWKLLGPDAIITGTLAEFGTVLDLDIQVAVAETGAVLARANTRIDKSKISQERDLHNHQRILEKMVEELRESEELMKQLERLQKERDGRRSTYDERPTPIPLAPKKPPPVSGVPGGLLH